MSSRSSLNNQNVGVTLKNSEKKCGCCGSKETVKDAFGMEHCAGCTTKATSYEEYRKG